MAQALDLGATFNTDNYIGSNYEMDTKLLMSDWYVIGETLAELMYEYEPKKA